MRLRCVVQGNQERLATVPKEERISNSTAYIAASSEEYFSKIVKSAP